MNFIEKFKDIRVLYNVESVENDFIYVKNKNEMLKEYIYEVIPINMLNSSVNEVYKILNLYIEFLKSFDVRFKILIRNYKFNKEEYIKRHMNMCDFKNDNMELYNNYIKDLNNKIDNKEIYNLKIYMCILYNKDIKDIETSFVKLSSMGIKLNKLEKSQIEELLYKTINKN